MKLLSRRIEKDGEGSISVIPEDQEDLWHAYNLIQEEDSLKCTTIRKVTTETATGSTSSQRVTTVLTIQVQSIHYDTQSGSVHVKGRNIVENQHVKMGAYHTLDLEVNRKFTLWKPCWDLVHLERVEMACDVTTKADVAAVVMTDGLAHLCLLTNNTTIVRAKIDMSIPRKRKGSSAQHDKALDKFYEALMQAILRHVNFEVVKCMIVASPGFVRETFMEYLMTRAKKDGLKAILDNKSKFLLVHSSSGFKHSLKEVLADPGVEKKLSDTKATMEVRALETFHELLQTEPHRAYYGYAHVEKALSLEAIDTLMVSDILFRSKDLVERKKYVNLVERTREQGAKVLIFSSLHVSGEQLSLLGGVAAILRFPVPEIDDEDEDEDEDSD